MCLLCSQWRVDFGPLEVGGVEEEPRTAPCQARSAQINPNFGYQIDFPELARAEAGYFEVDLGKRALGLVVEWPFLGSPQDYFLEWRKQGVPPMKPVHRMSASLDFFFEVHHFHLVAVDVSEIFFKESAHLIKYFHFQKLFPRSYPRTNIERESMIQKSRTTMKVFDS